MRQLATLLPVRALTGALLCLVATAVPRAETSAPTFATDNERNTIEIFRYASPSVVNVNRINLVRDPRSFVPQAVPSGAGTGFVWSPKGYIVTNFHVVEGARKISITLPDQSRWPAQVVGLAPDKDLAVLKIDAPAARLKALPRGDSSKLAVGHKVLAIGNPFGLDATLTTGVVSALGRQIEAPNRRTIRNVIQTDAAINPGNSGGPLLNSSGKLVGVNTMIYSPSGASAGIGFAIPVNTVKRIVPQLIQYGRLIRPVFGVELAPASWARHVGVEGVAILHAPETLPAARAGLRGARRDRWGRIRLGDIIIAIDEHPTRNRDEFLTALEAHKPGDTVTVQYVRDERVEKVTVKLAEPDLD